MDVVRKNITALRGSVDVQTEPGAGSRFTIRLPLTLAIIDGFLTGVGKSSYVIPLDMVVECIELADASTDRDYLNLRGEVLPFVRLREMFEAPGPARRVKTWWWCSTPGARRASWSISCWANSRP
jgi:two-component system chemotaxis sensor kinase CheA